MFKRHTYLIDTKHLKVYWRGSFCWLEIDVLKHTFQFFTKKGIYNHFTN